MSENRVVINGVAFVPPNKDVPLVVVSSGKPGGNVVVSGHGNVVVDGEKNVVTIGHKNG